MSAFGPDTAKSSHREIFRALFAGLLCLGLIGVSGRTTWLLPLYDALYEQVYFPLNRTIQAPLRWSKHKISRYFSDREALASARHLVLENRELHAQVQLMAHYQAENRRLHLLMDSVARVREPVLVAELDDTRTEGYREEVTINKGSVDGVYEQQPVIDPFGLVGQVLRVYPHQAVVMLISDGRSRVPVYVERTQQRALVSGSAQIGLLNITSLRLGSDIRIGDRLVSSGLGGVFPRGYPVAEIIAIDRDQRGSFLKIKLQAFAHLDSLLEVLLLDRGDAPAVPFDNPRIPVGPPRPFADATSNAEDN